MPTDERRAVALSWWYVSLSCDSGFVGGAYIQAVDPGDAGEYARKLSEHTEPEALVIGPLSDSDMDENVPAGDRGRILSREELGEDVTTMML